MVIIAAVVAVGLFLVYPSLGPVPQWWAKYLPSSPVRLGLDLQGGLYLVLEVEADKAVGSGRSVDLRSCCGDERAEDTLQRHRTYFAVVNVGLSERCRSGDGIRQQGH